MVKRIFRSLLTYCVIIIFITVSLLIAFLHIRLNLFDKGDIPDMLIVFAVALVLSLAFAVVFSRIIAKNIVAPLDGLRNHLENPEEYKTYPELQPFVDELARQKKKQRRLSRQKKQFTANMSHELKTPLTSIAGYAELIETGIADEKDIKPFAGVIRKQALRLVSLSEDIIQLSQLEETDDGGKVAFTEIDLYDIAKECTDALTVSAQLRGISLAFNGESEVICANPSLIEELIYNLCENAIRYNKENGSVFVSVGDIDGKACLTVRDTGIGIEKKYQERIFERFFRVDKSRSKETGGTGLGLAIVKHIVKLHGASLEIDSKPGVGTTISVYFEK